MNIKYFTTNCNAAKQDIVNFNRNYNGLLDSIKSCINHRTFKSSYRTYMFETRYRRDHIGPQALQLNFKCARVVAGIVCHALVLTRKIISVINDFSEMVDIVS